MRILESSLELQTFGIVGFEIIADGESGLLNGDFVFLEIFLHQGAFDEVGAARFMFLENCLGVFRGHEGDEELGQVGVDGVLRRAQLEVIRVDRRDTGDGD